MTEREFDQKAEDLAARLECRIEAAAKCLEKGATQKYSENRLFRFTIRGISTAAEIGLLVGAKHLSGGGHKTAAMWCAGFGVVGLITELLRILIFRRER
ncbi:MAG TPA: hypothetical protein IAD32_01535 [Candidatus Scatavimonas merdigallinarum]|uniref:Uncharacterized protein n=1 Tax=Candidatus Scatavimonas merdigallinarum TaxID=2840914 RepID=A0A9D0ZG72_9FIRM|nr:hypothetical protein [Candidatus Scatavimonas merdigallinarum]